MKKNTEKFIEINEDIIEEKNAEEIMIKYKPLVTKIARRYFVYGGDIDDLIQEGMIGLYKAIKSYDESKQASFKTFAGICITRQIQSVIRSANSKKNIVFLEIMDNSESNFDIATNKENPEENYITNQSYQNFWKDIKNILSKKELEILIVFLEGYSYDQIAEKLVIQKKSVDNALVRIRTKLSHILNDK